jgi:hypothetical protein
MLNREYFLNRSQTYGPFDLDGARNNDGLNYQVAEGFCCPARPGVREDEKATELKEILTSVSS